MPKTKSGFTIVELLIVIVVVGILAAITIVAYNGIQTRAKNTKTINATNQWIKAIQMLQADTGNWPPVDSCLGKATTYPGNAWCWPSSAWQVQPSFQNSLAPYIGTSYPEPDTTDVDTATGPRRGAFYYNAGANKQIYMMQVGVSSCPNMSIPFVGSGTYAGGMACIYQLN